MFIFYWISFEYSGYRASYFCCTIYIYIFIHIHQIYIYFGRFAAWITYSLITPQYALFFAYKLKYRNFLIFYSACIPTYSLLHTFAGMERFARSQILYYLLYFMYAFFMSTVILLIVPLLSISMYSYYIYAYSTLRACSITYLFAIFFYVFL